MNCPVDDTQLSISDRQGVEIDYCPKCRGVWLDRGELDKIIDRSESFNASASSGRSKEHDERPSRSEHSSDSYAHNDKPYRDKKKRKESFLGELFDF